MVVAICLFCCSYDEMSGFYFLILVAGVGIVKSLLQSTRGLVQASRRLNPF